MIMHVLLIGAELEENLALRYLAAALEAKGHQATFATFDRATDGPAVVAQALREQPNVIGMSMTFQFRAKEFGSLAAALREGGYQGHVTAGGHFVTFAFREVLEAFPTIDSVIRHEGEETLPELCAALTSGKPLSGVRGLVFRGADGEVVCNEARPLVADLDTLPFPKRIGVPQQHLGIPAAFLVGSRGCYGHCTFCCIHAYLKSAGGPAYRVRSPANLADEMAELRRTRGARMFVFHDDDFFTRDARRDLARVTALRDELRVRNVRDIALVVKARPDDIDQKVFRVLREIGLLRVYLGVEAGSTQGLRVLGRGVDLDTNRAALSWLRAQGVYTCFNMLVFDPESTLESLRESFSFLREYADVPMNFCRTEIYVGTPLMAKLAREGRLVGDVFGWDYAIAEPAAERAFRIFASAFLDRNFRCDGLMNSTLGLGYQLHLLRTFHPKVDSGTLGARVNATTRKVNLDCVERMERILDFSASERSLEAEAVADFTHATTEEANRAGAHLEEEVAEVTRAIVDAVTSPPRAASARRGSSALARWGMLSAASLTLAPLSAVDCKTSPPPPDPLPPPSVVMPPPPDPLPPPSVVMDPLPAPRVTQDAQAPTAKPRPPLPPPPDPLPPPHQNKP
jgi:anaerobic magnesium-protoporphyrin IX monomethyl ester cyclase